MKKQAFFVLLLSAFLLSGCNTPDPTSQSKEPEQTTEPAGQSSGEQSTQTQPASSTTSKSSSNTSPSYCS